MNTAKLDYYVSTVKIIEGYNELFVRLSEGNGL